MLWVLEDAPVENHGELAVLYALAERANDRGECAWPSQEWIAFRARCTDRTVRNHLRALESRGVIRKGNPKFVDHVPANRRPTVWDLNLEAVRAENSRPENISGRKIQAVRPENSSSQAGKSEQFDRKPVSDKASLNRPEPSRNRSKNSNRHPLPDGWRPSEKVWGKAKDSYPGIDLEAVLRDFSFYWQSQSGSRALKSNWDRAWSNWLINEAKWNKSESAAKPDIRKMLDEIVAQEEEVDESAPF